MKTCLVYTLLFAPLFLPLIYLSRNNPDRRGVFYTLAAFIFCHIINVIAYFFNLFGDDFGNFLYGAHYWVTSGLFIYLYSTTKELPLHRKILYSSLGIAATVIIGIFSLIFLLIIDPPDWR